MGNGQNGDNTTKKSWAAVAGGASDAAGAIKDSPTTVTTPCATTPNKPTTSDSPAPIKTVHGEKRASQRGVSDEHINDAINNPLQKDEVTYDKYGRPGQKIIGKKATVVVNPKTGQVITTYPTSARRRKKLMGS